MRIRGMERTAQGARLAHRLVRARVLRGPSAAGAVQRLPSEKGGEAMREYVNGDCMDYLPKFSDNEFDLAIVDPPYGGGGSADANDTFNGAIVGRVGGQFAR